MPTNLEIREGTAYQCPEQEWAAPTQPDENYGRQESCAWLPRENLDSIKLRDYLSIAVRRFRIGQDRQLKAQSKEVGPKIDSSETKVMQVPSVHVATLQIGGVDLEKVDTYVCLGQEENGLRNLSLEIARRRAAG
ncbi:unnamed protein product [Gongylonema pulchrum]|uniref:Uncharacterized protein n=1 Tax=Gongylonema pulchrum TaxID=637853 RepID=A0A3P6PH31_9BILA|nr:unnamed protein product [Gongylonema pulchrum]